MNLAIYNRAMKNRLHILSTVNAAAVQKSGSMYTIRGVCGAVDNVVMNRRLYPGDVLAANVATLEGKPAPAGHPQNSKGQYIPATNGEALASAWMGSYCTNARHENGRTLTDIVINGDQAKAHPKGAKLIERLDAAINGENVSPIHVSTGLMYEAVNESGVSNGKPYTEKLTAINYDHLAILLDEKGAATPEQGVGMFLNSEGAEQAVETIDMDSEDETPPKGFMAWLKKLVAHYNDEPAPITNTQEGKDEVKEKIQAALNAAGINSDGLDDSKLLSAYNGLIAKPHIDALAVTEAKLTAINQEKAKAEQAELDALAGKLATNSSLTVDDLKALGLKRLKEISATAAPVVVGNHTTKTGDEFAGYSLNA
jgi:hypothetical protein